MDYANCWDGERCDLLRRPSQVRVVVRVNPVRSVTIRRRGVEISSVEPAESGVVLAWQFVKRGQCDFEACQIFVRVGDVVDVKIGVQLRDHAPHRLS